ncbi:neuronal acetylcholine receptor subunit alpha-7-like isoform X1 [Xenia sp. Carnegie-2017]|uniref:neuronal acetylcholine receptor subunit alpha-7-like isoform X1 n=1 Tax=Xenia sp. Carnegie-2017 TaxID=2897299 RepID=UPI001F041BDD|nr:neuronal acetylcholine receptor subunit alpha-7-like isoform X1 [Xenia sp. Carnegie-2017]
MHLDNGLLIPLFVFLLCKGNLVNGNNEKARLIKDLLKNYCPDARPFDNYSSSYNNNSRPFKNDFRPVKVYFSLTYHQLQDFNEPAQIAKSLVWIRTYWTDINLKWNASEYGGNEHVHISAEKIWIPDLTLYNSANGEGEKMYDLSYQARVQSNGNVSLASPLLLESICHINLKDFPFDAQKCELRIGSWTYDSSDLDLKIAPSTKGIIMDHLETNSLWHYKHKSAKVVHSSIKYTCCKFPFHDLIYTFEFQRKSLYYVLNIIIPTMFLSALTCISFCFPPHSGERISLGISVMIGIYLIMIVVNEQTPVSSDTRPMLTLFLICIQASTFVSLLLTAIALQLHHKTKPLPSWFRKFCECIIKKICRICKTMKKKINEKICGCQRCPLSSTPCNNNDSESSGGIHNPGCQESSPSSDAGSIPMDLQEETNSTNLQEEISTENNDSWEYDIFSFYFFLGVFGIFFIVILIYAV